MADPVDPWVLTLADAALAGPGVAGGKGWNLGRLDAYGFRVPETVVLSADVYRAVLAQPAIAARVAALASLAAGDVLKPEAQAALAELRAAIAAAPWPDGVEPALDGALAARGLDAVPVAVRSSATGEDSGTASFAGIHDSELSVSGPAAVRAAVARCFGSLWTPRAVAYRRHLKLADAEVAGAVAICRMILGAGGAPPRAAGVAFTCDPRTGRRDRILISSVAGLADALVAGRVTPHDSAYAFVGHRLTRLEHAAGAPLSGPALEELAHLCLRVHWAFGDGQDPQDIEWVHDGGAIWLVQARPVTRPADPRPAPIHAWPTVWCNANIKDAVPVVLSTMGWSMVQSSIDPMLFIALDVAGHDVPKGVATVRRFGGRAYFDITLLQWVTCSGFGLSPAEFNRTMGGTPPELPIEPLERWPVREQLAVGGRAFWLMKRLRRVQPELEPAMRAHRAAVAKLSEGDARSFSRAVLAERLRALSQEASEFQTHFMLAAALAGFWFANLEKLTRRAAPDGAAELAGSLLAACGGIESAEQGLGIVELAQAAVPEPAARAWVEASPRDPIGWRALPADSAFAARLRAFLDRFGHRTVYEADVALPRWIDDPTYLIDQVRAALALPAGHDPREAGRRARARGEAALAGLSFFWRTPARWIARKAGEAAAAREGAKSAMSLALLPTHRLMKEAGRRMVAAGLLARPEHAFELATIEALDWLDGRWDGRGMGALVDERLERRVRWLAAPRPPDCFHVLPDGTLAPIGPRGEGLPAGLRAPEMAAIAGAIEDGWLAGLPLSSGVAEGTARLIAHPDEGHRLQPGEVLVAPSTDPAWTPLFLRASALVMETGGYLSHGAIVAREYGLPAVANVPALFEKVREGQTLTVDGGRGRVRTH